MDNATFYHFSDSTKPGDDKRELDGIIGTHIDDALEVGNEQMKEKVIENTKKRFTFGSQESLPFRYVGLNIEKEDEKVTINQDHFVDL